jgi:hypothetical protein
MVLPLALLLLYVKGSITWPENIRNSICSRQWVNVTMGVLGSSHWLVTSRPQLRGAATGGAAQPWHHSPT